MDGGFIMTAKLKFQLILCIGIFICFQVLLTGCDDAQSYDAWDDFTPPTIIYVNMDANGNGQIFDQLVPDPETFMQTIATNVAQILYFEPDEVPYISIITLIIDDVDGVAWKTGARPEITITLSSRYLQQYSASGRDVLAEINGILHHEIAHGYQYDDGGRYGALSGVIEGVADTVRYYAGYIDESDRHPGGNWDDGYKTTAFFFAWIEDVKHEEFLYELNQSLHPDDGIDWTPDQIEFITGESVTSLWDQYQVSFNQ